MRVQPQHVRDQRALNDLRMRVAEGPEQITQVEHARAAARLIRVTAAASEVSRALGSQGLRSKGETA